MNRENGDLPKSKPVTIIRLYTNNTQYTVSYTEVRIKNSSRTVGEPRSRACEQPSLDQSISGIQPRSPYVVKYVCLGIHICMYRNYILTTILHNTHMLATMIHTYIHSSVASLCTLEYTVQYWSRSSLV